MSGATVASPSGQIHDGAEMSAYTVELKAVELPCATVGELNDTFAGKKIVVTRATEQVITIGPATKGVSAVVPIKLVDASFAMEGIIVVATK